MTLKYATEIAKIECCPPEGVGSVSCVTFRFVHDPVGDGRNWLPPARLDQQRKYRDAVKRCAAHALSLFITREHAIESFKFFQSTNRRVHLTLGTHLAKGAVAATDGLATNVNAKGHFDLFEFEGVDMSPKFEIVEVLHDA